MSRRTFTAVVEVTVEGGEGYTSADLADAVRDLVFTAVREETELDVIIMTVSGAPGTYPAAPASERLPRISGTIHRTDGGKVEFQITDDGGHQWGVPPSELGRTAELLHTLSGAAHEAGFFYDEDDECECSESYRHRGIHTPGCPADEGDMDDDKCRECGEPTDDGEGWDGKCGNCADADEDRRRRS